MSCIYGARRRQREPADATGGASDQRGESVEFEIHGQSFSVKG